MNKFFKHLIFTIIFISSFQCFSSPFVEIGIDKNNHFTNAPQNLSYFFPTSGPVQTNFFSIEKLNSTPLRDLVYEKMMMESKKGIKIVKELRLQGKNLVFDVIGIGAGPQNGATFSKMRQSTPSASILILEEGSHFGVFEKMSGTFRVNTSELNEGSGNILSGAPIQVQDFNWKDKNSRSLPNQKFVSSDVFGDVSMMSFYSARNPVLFNSGVTKIKERTDDQNWPARYCVKTENGLTFFAATIVLGTGMGTPNTEIGDESTKKLITKSEKESNDHFRSQDYSYIPSIESIDSLLSRHSALKKLEAKIDENFKSKELIYAVIGAGDGGNIAIEELLGFNSKKPDSENAKKIYWIGQRSQTADEFKNALLKRGEDKLERYGKIGENIGQGKKITSLSGHLSEIHPLEGGSYLIKYGNGETVQADRIIVAAGYKNKVLDLLSLNTNKHHLNLITRDNDNSTRKRQCGTLAIGKKIEDQEIYIIGNASEQNFDDPKYPESTLIGTEDWGKTLGGYLDLLSSRSASCGDYLGEKTKYRFNSFWWIREEENKIAEIDLKYPTDLPKMPKVLRKNFERDLAIQIKIQLANFLSKVIYETPGTKKIDFYSGTLKTYPRFVIKGIDKRDASFLTKEIFKFNNGELYRNLHTYSKLNCDHGYKIKISYETKCNGSVMLDSIKIDLSELFLNI